VPTTKTYLASGKKNFSVYLEHLGIGKIGIHVPKIGIRVPTTKTCVPSGEKCLSVYFMVLGL